jgi:glycosyltransferase involved in cell wall biosynthesis
VVFGKNRKGGLMSRIVIDGRMINESGIGRYLQNLLKNLQLLDKKNEYYVLHLRKDYDRQKYQKNFHKVLANYKWYTVSEQINLPRTLQKISPDLVHFPHFNVPILYGGKFVVTIHDLIHQHYQMRRATTRDPLTYKIKQLGYEAIFKSAVKKSEKIFTPSDFVKGQLINERNIESDKIIVTPEGVDDEITLISSKLTKDKMDSIMNKFSIKPPFIFFVGNTHPHKNIEALIESFLEIREKYQYLQLVLSGRSNFFWEKVKSKYNHKSIIYTDFVTSEELVAIYKNAQVFVLPSLEEGFGLPIIEAMAVGCPVVASNAASLPEVGGDAAVYMNPKDREDIKDKIQQVLNSEKLRQNLIGKGKERVKLFSWKKMAQQTLEIYQTAI